jgi:hypothetical protein
MSDTLPETPSKTWPWFQRNVEGHVNELLRRPGTVLLVRGQRRVGKSSVIQHCLSNLNLEHKKLIVLQDDASFLAYCKHYLEKDFDSIWALKDVFIDLLREGTTLVFEELQNASDIFQVFLQTLIDEIAYKRMHETPSWGKAGIIVLMGSLPNRVDEFVTSRRRPLYSRVKSRLSIQAFDTQEFCNVLKHFDITNASLILSLHTMFGGFPFLYEEMEKHLYEPNIDRNELIKQFCASEHQMHVHIASSYLTDVFGDTIGDVLRYAMEGLKNVPKDGNTKQPYKNQLAKIKEKCNIDSDSAMRILKEELCGRFGVMELVQRCTDGQLHSFQVTDPVIQFFQQVVVPNRNITRPGLIRELNYFSDDQMDQLEGAHFETWVRDIIEDRYMTKALALLPHADFTFQDFCGINISPKTVFDGEKQAEVDFLASIPQRKILLVGSCKRNSSKTNHQNLRQHWENLAKIPYTISKGIPKKEELSERGWTVRYIHFCAFEDEAGTLQRKILSSREATRDLIYGFTLAELLEDFHNPF